MEVKGDNIYVNIKELPNLDQMSPDDLILVETPSGTATIPFQDFIIDGNNTTFYGQIQSNTTNINTLSTSVNSLSASLNTVLSANNYSVIQSTSASLYSTIQTTSASLYSTIQTTSGNGNTAVAAFSAAALLPFAWLCYESGSTILSNNVSLVTLTPTGTIAGQIQTVVVTFTSDIGTSAYITQITPRNSAGFNMHIESIARTGTTMTFVLSAGRDISTGLGFDVTCSI